ncbi:hypothetical protein MLP_30500 [Microlunatus phosphovorus NM-1]|uniref:Uncharacterized protein n=1 Tax=Microlunatus phosphovorus (strain ATCC 700054 / DSM 10555 / JCM 9379 / NBRC 101784 / NCIMB 13414 / VKM Ac-1990 / NM-1) TaxID=1032480 RepID=F5XKJ2_MICPN|nr:hypothetical protein [Microlunatus phosphovorus]BAK36064.1 hypothetical protein MLP_30500 [Microlunatus phosphovorus NM-1]
MSIDTDHLAVRILQGAMTDATRLWWLKRAEQLEAARHRPGVDWPGRASENDLQRRWWDLTEAAQACRARAEVGVAEDVPELIATVLAEVA